MKLLKYIKIAKNYINILKLHKNDQTSEMLKLQNIKKHKNIDKIKILIVTQWYWNSRFLCNTYSLNVG